MSRRGIALTAAPLLLAGLLSGCAPDPEPSPPPSPVTSDPSTPDSSPASPTETEPSETEASTSTPSSTGVTGSGEFGLVIGQHAHVVQPVEKVNSVWTVYSTGNLMAGMPAKDFHEVREGMIEDISFREKPSGGFEVSGVEWSPTLNTLPEQEADGIPRVRVVPDALAYAPEHLRRLMKASADHTRGILAPTAPAGLVERTAPLR